MCGIVGAIGNNESIKVVLEGLEKLEYRGYDSCGIAYKEAEKLNIQKSIKRISDLKSQVNASSDLAFGHTRWATHGGVNLENAHPHYSNNKHLTTVHNGVIENFAELKTKYLTNCECYSQTDSEIITNVLAIFLSETGNMQAAIKRFMQEVHGSYALIVYVENDDNVYVLKHKTPIVIGKSDEMITIASDPGAVSNYTSHFYRLENYEYAIINKTTLIVNIVKDNEEVPVTFEKINLANTAIDLGDYEHFMLKEIEEQPAVIANIIEKYRDLEIDPELKKQIMQSDEIYLVASGTSSYAGLIAKRIFAEKLQKKVEVVIGSEFGYDENIVSENAMFIFVSQSGETADSMIVFNKYKDTHPTLAVTNVEHSQLDSGCQFSYQLHAGIEVAVASTKAYTAQVAVLAILIYKLAEDDSIFTLLSDIAQKQSTIIHNQENIQRLAKVFAKYDQAFILGRLIDFDVAKEVALKMKEITYININEYPAGELKHGPIALIDEQKIVLTLSSMEHLSMQTRSNVEEVRTRGGKVITIGNDTAAVNADDIVVEYGTNTNLNALVTVVIGQLLAYYTALELERDVDKPRNLAKSVTVE